MGDYCKLIVTAPGNQSQQGGFLKAWLAIREVLRKHVKTEDSKFESHRQDLSTGLPCEFPFLFDPSAAEALANDLRGVGCEARIVRSDD